MQPSRISAGKARPATSWRDRARGGRILRIEFEPLAQLPPLAWCARARAGAPVQVRHGLGVETRADGFVEGAWDGDFDAFDFDRSPALAGSGARVRGAALVFAAPFHPLERLFVLRGRGEARISNSLVFLLAEAGDGLDLSHAGYFFDLIGQVRRGIAPPATQLRTAAGSRVELFPCCNLELRPDATLHRAPKPLGAPPVRYADYFDLLVGTTRRLAANAGGPGRRARYRLVAACSRGYDSTASATIASLAGCREGVTFIRSAGPSGHPLIGVTEELGDDSGAETLRALGMQVTEFDRGALPGLPGHPRAEFYISSPAAITDATARLMEGTLRGSVFVSGRHGERYWGPTRRCSRTDFREVDDCHLSGQALGEFRLRVGFVHFPAPYVGALHGPAIFRITHSVEMRPWKLGTGYYDRPIPRRIAEDAGIPREAFGQRKRGAGMGMRELGADSERDFQDFLRSEVPASIRQRLDPRPVAQRVGRHRRLTYVRAIYAHLPLVAPTLDLLGTERLHMMWNSTALYHFHWGFARIRDRYGGL